MDFKDNHQLSFDGDESVETSKRRKEGFKEAGSEENASKFSWGRYLIDLLDEKNRVEGFDFNIEIYRISCLIEFISSPQNNAQRKDLELEEAVPKLVGCVGARLVCQEP